MRKIPVTLVMDLIDQGANSAQIVRELRERGYSPAEISDAINQAKVKSAISQDVPEPDGGEEVELPQPQEGTESFVELAEEIINEKWANFKRKVGDIEDLKNNLDINLEKLDRRMKKVETSIKQLHSAASEKFREQETRIKDTNTEIKALKMTFSKVLEPLATNVKIKSGILTAPKKVIRDTKKKGKKKSIEDHF